MPAFALRTVLPSAVPNVSSSFATHASSRFHATRTNCATYMRRMSQAVFRIMDAPRPLFSIPKLLSLVNELLKSFALTRSRLLPELFGKRPGIPPERCSEVAEVSIARLQSDFGDREVRVPKQGLGMLHA